MSAYSRKWERRPSKVDCWHCGGDKDDKGSQPGGNELVEAGECCAETGLDAIPWTELFRAGRARWNGGGL